MSARTKQAKENAQKVSLAAEQKLARQQEKQQAEYSGPYNPILGRLGVIRKKLISQWYASQKTLEKEYLVALSEVESLDQLKEVEAAFKAKIEENDKRYNDTGVFQNKPQKSEIDMTDEITTIERVLDAERLLSELVAPVSSGVQIEAVGEQITETVAS